MTRDTPHTHGRALRQGVETVAVVDWTQVEPLAALRCSIAVALVLVGGYATGRVPAAVFCAVGALSVGFGSFQGAYRSRAAVMVIAACGMALSIFVGTLSGHSPLVGVVVVSLWSFFGGLLVALGPGASYVGLQTIVAIVVADAYPDGLGPAVQRALLVFAGGLLQTAFVVGAWPLRRFPAERRALARIYGSLAGYAAALRRGVDEPPEPHTLAAADEPETDPQPFARSSELLIFQALFNEAERIRASLAALAVRTLRRTPASGCGAWAEHVERILDEMGAAIAGAREPRELAEVWDALQACRPSEQPHQRLFEALMGQLRGAWRVAAALDAAATPVPEAKPRRVPPLRLPSIADHLTTLRSNLSLHSTACRHAIRLAVALCLATAAFKLWSLERGYWLAITAVLVLKPDFHETITRGFARVAGTLIGAALATGIIWGFHPRQGVLIAVIVLAAWIGYAIFRASYALFTVCITVYVILLLGLSGAPEASTAMARTINTVAGAALALLLYFTWPTWESRFAHDTLADLLDAQARYGERVLAAYADASCRDAGELQRARASARLARSNAEATLERMLTEPVRDRHLNPRLVLAMLAAVRRFALAALALHAGLEHAPAPTAAVRGLAGPLEHALRGLAASLRTGTAPPELPPLRDLQLALPATLDALVLSETDLMVDSVNTIAGLLAREFV